MPDFTLGEIESRFADLIWSNEPIPSGEPIRLAGAARCIHWYNPLLWLTAADSASISRKRVTSGYWLCLAKGPEAAMQTRCCALLPNPRPPELPSPAATPKKGSEGSCVQRKTAEESWSFRQRQSSSLLPAASLSRQLSRPAVPRAS